MFFQWISFSEFGSADIRDPMSDKCWYKLFSHITLDTDAPSAPRISLCCFPRVPWVCDTDASWGLKSVGAFILLYCSKHCWTWFWSGVSKRKATLRAGCLGWVLWFWKTRVLLLSTEQELDGFDLVLNWAVGLGYAVPNNQPKWCNCSNCEGRTGMVWWYTCCA